MRTAPQEDFMLGTRNLVNSHDYRLLSSCILNIYVCIHRIVLFSGVCLRCFFLQRFIIAQSVSVNISECSDVDRSSISTDPPSPRFRDFERKELLEREAVKWTSQHDKAVTCISSHQMWLPEQDLKDKVSQIPA